MNTLCVICWYASRAGAQGSVSKFALHPNSKSGRFSAHVDVAMGFSTKETGELFHVQCPTYGKFDISRATYAVPMQLPHEVFSLEADDTPGFLDNLDQSVKDSEWEQAYWNHVVVKRHRNVLPTCLYLDGVPFSKRDGVLGIWSHSMLSEKRHLLAVLRKSSFCKCGCGGHCTVHPILATLRWSYAALAEGKWPRVGPDGKAVQGWRAARAGEHGVVGTMVHLKGDWMEFSSHLGLSNWSHATCPCPFCTVEKPGMFDLAPFDPLHSPWEHLSHEHYEDACEMAECHVSMTRSQHRDLVALLAYSRSQRGNKGRCLLEAYPPLDLEKDDRLCPSLHLMDVAQFDYVFDDPGLVTYSCCFWRKGYTTRAKWCNVLFDPSIGITVDSLAIDILHTLHLGVGKSFCMAAIWHLISSDVWKRGNIDVADRDMLGVLDICRELWAWYSAEAKGSRTIHRLEDLTVGMIGTEYDQKLATKVAETKTLVFFCVLRCGNFGIACWRRTPIVVLL